MHNILTETLFPKKVRFSGFRVLETSMAAQLNLWVGTAWRLNDLFTGVTYQISCLSDIYIMFIIVEKL